MSVHTFNNKAGKSNRSGGGKGRKPNKRPAGQISYGTSDSESEGDEDDARDSAKQDPGRRDLLDLSGDDAEAEVVLALSSKGIGTIADKVQQMKVLARFERIFIDRLPPGTPDADIAAATTMIAEAAKGKSGPALVVAQRLYDIATLPVRAPVGAAVRNDEMWKAFMVLKGLVDKARQKVRVHRRARRAHAHAHALHAAAGHPSPPPPPSPWSVGRAAFLRLTPQNSRLTPSPPHPSAPLSGRAPSLAGR